MPKMLGIAVAWMRKEDWPRWLALDPDFQPDYEHWLKRMTDAVARLEAEGKLCETVEVLPDEFLAWCRASGCDVNSQNRSVYAAQILAKRHEARHQPGRFGSVGGDVGGGGVRGSCVRRGVGRARHGWVSRCDAGDNLCKTNKYVNA